MNSDGCFSCHLCFRTAIINEDMKLQKEFEDNEKQLLKKLKRVNSFKILLSDAKSEILKLTTFLNLCKLIILQAIVKIFMMYMYNLSYKYF